VGFVGRVREALSGMHSARCRIKHREGWTRCARPTGSLFATRSGCPTGCASCRTLSRGFSSLPQACYMRKKSPHFHASSSLNMAVREGLTRFARPAGSLFAARSGCPTGCRQLLNPQSRVLIPPFRENINEKSPYFRTSSYLKYGGEGGIDSLRSPCGQPTHCVHGLSNWLSPVVEPSVEGSHPSRRRATCEKKARIFMRALL